MSDPWVRTIRRETGLVEHKCSHGVGHPAEASADWQDQIRGHAPGTWMSHGCDGCCRSTEWQLADLREGVHRANELLIEFAAEARGERPEGPTTCPTCGSDTPMVCHIGLVRPHHHGIIGDGSCCCPDSWHGGQR